MYDPSTVSNDTEESGQPVNLVERLAAKESDISW